MLVASLQCILLCCGLFAVAIPLVNPQLELLPVHFATDPGPDYDWQLANECCEDFDLPTDRKIGLLERYMDVKINSVPPLENVKRMEATSRLTHRRGSSLDSAQINAFVYGATLEQEDRRKQGSTLGVPRQIQGAVVRTFGSLGQSVSQKLKSLTSRSSNKVVSVGTATQSSRRNSLAFQMWSDHRRVPLLKLPLIQHYHYNTTTTRAVIIGNILVYIPPK